MITFVPSVVSFFTSPVAASQTPRLFEASVNATLSPDGESVGFFTSFAKGRAMNFFKASGVGAISFGVFSTAVFTPVLTLYSNILNPLPSLWASLSV